MALAVGTMIILGALSFFVHSRRESQIASVKAVVQRDLRVITQTLRQDMSNAVENSFERTGAGSGTLSISMDINRPDGSVQNIKWNWLAPNLRRSSDDQSVLFSSDVIYFDLIPYTSDMESGNWGKYTAEITIEKNTGLSEPRDLVELNTSLLMVLESDLNAKANRLW